MDIGLRIETMLWAHYRVDIPLGFPALLIVSGPGGTVFKSFEDDQDDLAVLFELRSG